MGAGIMHWEVYSDGAKNGYTIVGGECPTVGAVGGFLQGGGVSSFHSFTKGLAVDNVLEYQVVTANVCVPQCLTLQVLPPFGHYDAKENS